MYLIMNSDSIEKSSRSEMSESFGLGGEGLIASINLHLSFSE